MKEIDRQIEIGEPKSIKIGYIKRVERDAYMVLFVKRVILDQRDRFMLCSQVDSSQTS